MFLLFFIIGKTKGQTNASWDKGCTEEYFKVMGYYEKYIAPKSYFKYNNYSIVKGEKSENIITEFWRNGQKFKCKNSFMTAYQDEKISVVISHGRKMILIRDFVLKNDEDPDAFIKKMTKKVPVDSLMKMYSKIVCGHEEGKKFIDLTFNKEYFSVMGMKSIRIYYNDKSQLFTKGLYEIYSKDSDEPRTDVYEYLVFSEQFDEATLEGALINKVIIGQKLQPQYYGYNLKDFRNKK